MTELNSYYVLSFDPAPASQDIENPPVADHGG